MGEWVGAWDGAIWDDFWSWSCPFPFPTGDMDNWGYGRLGIGTGRFPSPIVPHFTRYDAFQGYKVHLCVF